MQQFTTHSEAETISLGVELASQLRPGSVVALYGDLGSGKTRFAQGVCRGLGVHEHVASPTFTIISEYHGTDGLMVYHFDFYRLDSSAEILDLGFEEYVNGDGVCLIEWAEKASGLMPEERFDVTLRLGADEQTREVTIDRHVEVPA